MVAQAQGHLAASRSSQVHVGFTSGSRHMAKSWITLGALAALVAALSIFAWMKPAKVKDGGVPVSPHKAADAKSLKVMRDGKPVATLEKRGALWQIVEPFKAPADDFQVNRLLAVVEARASASYPPDLGKYELNAPRAMLDIDGEPYALGAINNVTQEQYLLTRNTVYAVALRHGAAIPAQAANLARRTILAPGDKPVKFEFGVYSIAQDGFKWTITPTAELSQDMTNRWVAQWREGSALRVESAAATGDRKPTRELLIHLQDGSRVALGVVQSEPELIVRRADLGLQWVYTGDIGRQMLLPPPVAAAPELSQK